MLKLARKKSNDPIQESLRSKKDDLNKNISDFIDDSLNFKWLLNGQPNKFFSRKSSLFKPVPVDPRSISFSLLNQFNKIVNDAKQVISAQLEYSKSKTNKIQVKADFLIAFEDKYGFLAEADSNLKKEIIDEKSKFNKQYNAFLFDLINFKRLMNGFPNKFYKQKSKITDPIPNNPATIIDGLSSQLKKLLTEASGLVEHQSKILEKK